MNIIDSSEEAVSQKREALRYHRSDLKTEATAQIPPINGVLLLACKKHDHPDLKHLRGGFWKPMERPPWFCVWPRTGVAALGLPPVRITVVRFQSSRVWIDPGPTTTQKVDLGWRTELGFEESLGDRRLQARNPFELARIPMRPETYVCQGDDGDAVSFTFPHCHQIWVVADWTSGRELSIIGCEYILNPEEKP